MTTNQIANAAKNPATTSLLCPPNALTNQPRRAELATVHMMATMKNDLTNVSLNFAVVAIIPTAKETNRTKTASIRMMRQSLMRAVLVCVGEDQVKKLFLFRDVISHNIHGRSSTISSFP